MWAEAEGLSTPCLPCRGEIRLISMTEQPEIAHSDCGCFNCLTPHRRCLAPSAHTPLARDKGTDVLQYVLAEHMKNF